MSPKTPPAASSPATPSASSDESDEREQHAVSPVGVHHWTPLAAGVDGDAYPMGRRQAQLVDPVLGRLPSPAASARRRLPAACPRTCAVTVIRWCVTLTRRARDPLDALDRALDGHREPLAGQGGIGVGAIDRRGEWIRSRAGRRRDQLRDEDEQSDRRGDGARPVRRWSPSRCCAGPSSGSSASE